ncbi:thioesterase II family protein [Amycolatopsis sp. NPDC088138]|uniref:thioesterase II family protein n=1 Tax=Amycolatopsis sp. NPDC088138 TaxID=3363938 RepID=UPI00381E0FC5
MKLFCLPYAGGSARVFADWPQELPASIRLRPLELPGRGVRHREPPATDLPALVRDLAAIVLAEAGEPVAVLGYSFGAFLAFEPALSLEQDHDVPVRHLITASARGAVRPPRQPPGPVRGTRELRDRLAAMNGTAPEVLRSDELMEIMLPVLRADFGMSDRYHYRPGPLLNCPITAFGGARDAAVSLPSLLAWRECTKGRFLAHQIPGDHFFLHTARSRFLGLVAGELGRHRTTEG